SALVRLNTLYQPNSFDVLCWTALYYLLLVFVKSENITRLYVCSAVFAIAFLNKYNIAFLVLGLLPAILITNTRKLFLQLPILGAVLLAFVLILPNIYWQYNNNFPVFHHLQELAATQLVNVSRVQFLKTQLLFFIGGLVPILLALYAFFWYKPFEPYRFFFWSLFFTLGIFLYLKAKDYYAMGIYPIYIAFGSVYLGNMINNGWKKYLQAVAIAFPILAFIPVLKVAFPNKSPEYIVQHQQDYQKLGLLRWEDGQDHLIPQDFADMLGWKELAAKVDNAYSKLPNNTLVLCDNYGQAGAINYHTKYGIKAVSFNADYINWFDLSKKYHNLIRIKEVGDIKEELTETAPFFIFSTIVDSITNPFSRERGTTIFVFSGAKIDIRDRLKLEIEEKKNFGRK
ncbi:MAG: glycosyltransferase family 39 protein, partial [Chitinophagaceae bacterium]